MRSFFQILFLVLLASTAAADMTPEPRTHYDEAKAAWLSGQNDLSALQGLSALANDSGLDAQVLLGMIYRDPQFYHHATKDLPRDAREAIFHKPNGRFGDRWLKVAAPHSPLAALLTDLDVTDWEERAVELAEAGLILDAIRAANIPMNQGNRLGTFRALSHPDLLPYTKVTVVPFVEMLLLNSFRFKLPEDRNQLAELWNELPRMTFKDRLLAMDWDDFVRFEDFGEKTDTLRLRGTALLDHPDLTPLTRILREVCPEDTGYHLGVLFHVGSDRLRQALISPLAPVISSEEWQNSGRFRADLLRVWHDQSPVFERLQVASPCFANAVLAES